MDDQWKKTLLEKDTTLTELQKNILLNGPRGLSQAWILGALKKRYQDEFA